MRSLWLKIAHTGGASAITMLSSAVGLMITARVLGPGGRGVYAAAIAWVGLFSAFGTLSLGQVVIHHVAGRPRAEWLSDVAGSVVSVTLGSTLVAWALLGALHLGSGGRLFGGVSLPLLAVAFGALPFLLWSDTIRYVLTAMGDVVVSNWAQIAGAVAGLVAMTLLLVGVHAGLRGAVTAYVLASAVPATATFFYVRRHAGTLTVRPALVGKLLRGSAQLHLNAIGAYLYTQASVLVLNYYRPPAETGYYQLAIQLLGMALIVSHSVSVVAFELVAKSGPDGAWPEQRRLLLHATGIVCLIAAAGYVLAPLGIRLVAGAQFMPTVPLFRILLPALVGATFASVMASQWIGRGLFLQAALMTLFVGVVSLTCDLVFIPSHGVYGALVSTLVTYGISVIGNGVMALWVQARTRSAGTPAVRPSA